MTDLAAYAPALGRSLNTVFKPPPALLAYVVDHTASPGLLAKAKTAGLPSDCAELVCAVMTRVIECLDRAEVMEPVACDAPTGRQADVSRRVLWRPGKAFALKLAPKKREFHLRPTAPQKGVEIPLVR